MDERTDVQGAMLSVLDSDKRLADHFGGKVRSLFHYEWSGKADK